MPQKLITTNHLFYGDNLEIIKSYLVTETIDLIYLDPPFNSNKNYNVLFKDESGNSSASQIHAFEDTWKWSEEAYNDLFKDAPNNLATIVTALVKTLGRNQLTAYIVMMSSRLLELHRVLKPTGSLYLHCDPTASHYLKLVLDTVFGPQNFVNEIVWKRAETVKGNFGQGSKKWDNNTDTILFYRKTVNNVFNPIFTLYSEEYISQFFKYNEPDTGRRYRLISMTGPGGAAKGNPYYEVLGVSRYWRYSKETMQELIAAGLVVQTKPGTVPQRKMYLDSGKGVPTQTLWDDIPGLHAQAAERLGYPTQKPLALLERIILASSNPGDMILDPFCGCGTSIAAAQKLGRRWIGIDITRLAVTLQKYRLRDNFNLIPKKDYTVIGEPVSLQEAHDLAKKDEDGRYQFQWWALGLVEGRPLGGQEGSKQGKKGTDKGIDGEITFVDDESGNQKQILVQVKSGAVSSRDIRDLVGTLTREGAAIGVFITLEKPSNPMQLEADSAGFYKSITWNKDYPRIQILTIEQLLNGAKIKMPPTKKTFKQAEKGIKPQGKQGEFSFDENENDEDN